MPTVDNSSILGAVIRAERKQQRLTQEQLAALAGVGIRFLRELGSGKETCRVGLALQVMQTLGLLVRVTARGEVE